MPFLDAMGNDKLEIGYIYCFTSPSGKCYIGQTWDIKRRYREHKNHKKQLKICSKFYCAMQKYGFESFIFDIIDYGYSETELNEKEKYYIHSFNSVEDGYNLTEGGESFKLSEETKIKLSKLKKKYFETHVHHRVGAKLTDEHKNILSEYMTKRTVSKETRRKMSDLLKGKPSRNPNACFKPGHTPWNKNGTQTPQTINKVRTSNLLKNKEKYGFIGIVPHLRTPNSKKGWRWLVRIYVKSKEKCCKVFDDKTEAAKWFDIKQVEYNGQDAPTNKSLGLL
jgi:group I intron endonuclease